MKGMRMLCTVFTLGRPGCGKSIATHTMMSIAQEKGWEAKRLNDYDILLDMFGKDIYHKCFRPIEYEGFDITDFGILEIALRRLIEQVREQMVEPAQHKLLFIEFARDDYNQSLQLFHDLLHNAHILLIDTDVETCIQRVRERVKHSQSTDDHFISDQALRNYYHRQELNLEDHHPASVQKIENKQSKEAFLMSIRQYIETLLAQQELPGISS
jgi:hypothetical protein